MLVLGLDPGLAITGYGLVAAAGQSLSPLAYGVIRTPTDASLAERLSRLYHQVRELIAEHRPDVAAVEELFFSSNARTAMTVGHARGVLLLALSESKLPIVEYTPMQVKLAVTGYGGAGKLQMQEMVRLLLGLEHVPRPDDAADALGVAICHHHSARLRELVDRERGEQP